MSALGSLARTPRSAGFSLIEVTVVLLIIGAILAGIYLLIRDAVRAQQVEQTLQQAIQLAANIREYTEHTDNSKLELNMTQLASLNLIPKDIQYDGTNYINAFGTIIDGCAANGTGQMSNACYRGNANNFWVNTGITVDLYPIPRSSCINLLSELSNIGPDVGLQMAMVNNMPILRTGDIHDNDKNSIQSTADITQQCLHPSNEDPAWGDFIPGHPNDIEVRLIFYFN